MWVTRLSLLFIMVANCAYAQSVTLTNTEIHLGVRPTWFGTIHQPQLTDHNKEFTLGANGTVANFRGSITYSADIYGAEHDNWHATAHYAFTDHIAGILNYSIFDIPDSNIATVGLNYHVEDRLSVTASAIGITSSQTTFAVGLGLNF